MAFSKATLIQRIRDILGSSEFEDKITADPTTGTTVTVADTTKWAVGNILEFQDDGERALVRSIDSSTAMTVKRAHGGTTAAANHAISTVIIKNPVYPYSRIVDSISVTVSSCWPWVWKEVETQLTPDTTKKWYSIGTDFIDLIRVFQLNDATPTGVNFFGSLNSTKHIQTMQGLPSSLVASTNGIRFKGGLYDSNNTIYVQYRAKITDTVSGGNYSDLDDGILADLVAYGAAARLVKNREVPRVSADDVTMGESTVTPGTRFSVGQALYEEYTRLRNNYFDELMRKSPPMKHWSR